LLEIKKIGHANVTTVFFGKKGVTEKYFDTFSTEQVFDQTYGSKKPSA
jgi:hypothetical protein